LIERLRGFVLRTRDTARRQRRNHGDERAAS
jgi:hypothetical protein